MKQDINAAGEDINVSFQYFEFSTLYIRSLICIFYQFGFLNYVL